MEVYKSGSKVATKYYQNKGGSEAATKTRFGGSFLFASVFTITAMALINTLRPADFSSASSLPVETLEKF